MRLEIITKSGQMKELVAIPGKLTELQYRRFGKVLLESAVEIAESAKDQIQRGTPRTGRVYRKASGRLHRASAPGEYPASDTGQLVNSIHAVKVSGLAVRVGSVANHGKFLELGTSRMAARPWLSREVHKELPNLRAGLVDAMKQEMK
jgi:hypothetical protein